MPELGVNIDHIASIRQIRDSKALSLQQAALICEQAGADSIVVHLREDRRHINDQDVSLLRRSIKTRLNLELSVARDIVDFACKIKPDQATIVPEKRKEVTTEGGLDAVSNFKKIKLACEKLENCGISVSLFIDPEIKQIEAAARLGIKKVELHTGRYADAGNKISRDKFLNQIKTAAQLARKKGLRVFAGHGLDYRNIGPIVKIKDIEELNIGYSIVCRAALFGLKQAVKEMKALL
ncbi:MAG: pyridoxine 5'-phosphate synthase [Candidatus Omnitrophica bacterium]|nr:pyridoxine 5'-phosphate synthase [Candidatus Omnitrophota bacterium]